MLFGHSLIFDLLPKTVTVCYARGKSKHNNGKNWKTADDKQATIDDITVFVIPLKNYRDEYREWKRSRKTAATANSDAASELANGNKE